MIMMWRKLFQNEFFVIALFLFIAFLVLIPFSWEYIGTHKFTEHLFAEAYGIIAATLVDVGLIHIVFKHFEKKKHAKDHLAELKCISGKKDEESIVRASISFRKLVESNAGECFVSSLRLRNLNVESTIMKQLHIDDSEISKSRFNDVTIENSTWESLIVSDVIFNKMNRTGTGESFSDSNNAYLRCTFRCCSFLDTKISATTFTNCSFIKCKFVAVLEYEVSFEQCNFIETTFRDSCGIEDAASTTSNKHS